MKIAFSEQSGVITADVFADEKFVPEEGVTEAGFIDLDSVSSQPVRGNIQEALNALHALVSVNLQYEGSLCYALEFLLEQVFKAGQQYEKSQ
jgi:hypothetical protein